MKAAGRSGIVIDLEQSKLLKRRMRSRGLRVLDLSFFYDNMDLFVNVN